MPTLSSRNVFGYIYRGTQPWTGAAVVFEQVASVTAGGVQQVAHKVTARTDRDGRFSVALWPTEQTKYLVTLPDKEQFEITVLEGTGDVNLELLRTIPVATNPDNLDSVIDHILSQVSAGTDGIDGIQGLQGEPGIDGIDGLSAYELAVDAGYVGTLDQWLTDLIGERGEQGIQGLPGADGLPGVNGVNGLDGVDGLGFTPENLAKLEGIQAGATANQTDSFLLNRNNHIGSQNIGSVTGLQSALDAKQPLSLDLSAIAALTGTGFAQRTSQGVWSLETPSGPAAGGSSSLHIGPLPPTDTSLLWYEPSQREIWVYLNSAWRSVATREYHSPHTYVVDNNSVEQDLDGAYRASTSFDWEFVSFETCLALNNTLVLPQTFRIRFTSRRENWSFGNIWYGPLDVQGSGIHRRDVGQILPNSRGRLRVHYDFISEAPRGGEVTSTAVLRKVRK